MTALPCPPGSWRRRGQEDRGGGGDSGQAERQAGGSGGRRSAGPGFSLGRSLFLRCNESLPCFLCCPLGVRECL